MTRKRFAAEEIVNKLRRAEVLISQGQTVAQACKAISITDHDVLPLVQGIRRPAFSSAQASE